jgi:hypothetical protein
MLSIRRRLRREKVKKRKERERERERDHESWWERQYWKWERGMGGEGERRKKRIKVENTVWNHFFSSSLASLIVCTKIRSKGLRCWRDMIGAPEKEEWVEREKEKEREKDQITPWLVRFDNRRKLWET